MGLSLAPIEARISKSAAQKTDRRDVYAKSRKTFGSYYGDFVRIRDRPRGVQPVKIHKALMKQHSHGPSDVVVAGPCRAQAVRRLRQEVVPRTTRNNAKPFKSARNTATCQAVIAVLALNDHLNQLRRPEAVQVNAGRGGADASGDRKLSTRTCMAIQKRKEHARPRWLTNGGSNTGDGDVGWVVNKHGFILGEVLSFANWHYCLIGSLPAQSGHCADVKFSGLSWLHPGADD
jgi:hypothetical protein